MPQRPISLYDAAGCRELDRIAIEEWGMAGFELMTEAGRRAFDDARELWPAARSVAVACGGGNNGGDGYVVAALAREAGFEVTLVASAPVSGADAKRAAALAADSGVRATPLSESSRGAFEGAALIVDAILGTGVASAPRGAAAAAIELVNAARLPVLAIDVPSGLDASTGHAPGAVVDAAATSTFIGFKAGLVTGRGPDHCGEIRFHDLGVPRGVHERVAPVARRVDARLVEGWLPERRPCAHKGDMGHVLLIGGNRGMSGALRIAAEAAARSGAGLVTAMTRATHAHSINVRQPEIMTRGVGERPGAGDAALAARASALAVGPGLGRDAWAKRLFDFAHAGEAPLVVDADALERLAARPTRRADRVLTPHPKEAARLLDATTEEIDRDRFAAVAAIVERYGGVCVLKGRGTLIADCERVFLCDRGNPGMASGGMGDCLTGVIAALLGRGLPPLRAAVVGAWIHAAAADLEARRSGVNGMLASDLYPLIRRLLDGRIVDQELSIT